MKLDDSPLIQIPAGASALLIFMPAPKNSPPLRTALINLADSLQKQFGEQVRILKIEQDALPEVFQGFAVTHIPTLVLIRMGIERWRQVGMPDKTLLTQLSKVL
ncbi:hypothetical protein GCM10028805_26030 [Spirosoma harenae]